MFHRQDAAINGDLRWIAKGRFGRKERQRSFLRTLNLSLDGARVELKGHIPFTVGTTARIQLGIRFCDVRILDVLHEENRTILRLSFAAPDRDFVTQIEEYLPTSSADRAQYEGKWIA